MNDKVHPQLPQGIALDIVEDVVAQQRVLAAVHLGMHAGEALAGTVIVQDVYKRQELARSSFEKILHPEPVAFSALSFAVLGASILVKLWMALFCGGLSRRIGSTALRATAQDLSLIHI